MMNKGDLEKILLKARNDEFESQLRLFMLEYKEHCCGDTKGFYQYCEGYTYRYDDGNGNK